MSLPLSLRLVAAAVSSFAVLLTAGCGAGTPATALPELTAGPQISGHVQGGQQPVSGAHVYLYGVSGGVVYSMLGSARPGSSLGGVTFSNAAGSGTDTAGNLYVITDANGNFSFNGQTAAPVRDFTYSCFNDQMTYALAVGGNPGLASGTSNAGLTLLADTGACVNGTLGSTLQIEVNEVSTVAMAYALAGT